MLRKGKKHIRIAIIASLLVIATLLVFAYSLQTVTEQNDPTSTHAPDNETSYWDEDRMKSASPAPMPTQ